MLRRVVDRLRTYDYVSGFFVDDSYGPIDGTLPLGAINFVGDEQDAEATGRRRGLQGVLPRRAGPADGHPGLRHGLAGRAGHHGGFGRESTFNNMAAMGPDFKRGFTDPRPSAIRHITPTVAHLMGFAMPAGGTLRGRVLPEALAAGPAAPPAPRIQYLRSAAAGGKQTILVYQEQDGVRYLDKGCFVTPTTVDADACR